MAIIFLESVGFSATHAISHMLRLDRRTCVSHGVQNFKNQNPEAINLPFVNFLAEMEEMQEKFENCISVHSLYEQSLISKAAATKRDVKFFGLARKSQKKQIISCMCWAINGHLDGRQDFMDILSQTHASHKASFNKIGLASNFLTCSGIYAIDRVLRYNVMLALNAERVFLMEEIIEDPEMFFRKAGIKLSDDTELKIQQGSSHRKKLENYEFFPDINETINLLLEYFPVNYNGNLYKVEDVETLLQKAS